MKVLACLVSAALLLPVAAQTPPPDPAPAPSEPAPTPSEPTPAPSQPAPQQPTPTPPPTTPAPQPTPPPPPPPPPPQPKPQAAWKQKIFFGGGVGASFGDVDYVEVSPMIGYRLTPRIHTGVGVFYRWKNDDRYGVSVDTHDWGGSLFGQLQLFRGFFAHAEYEYVDYEYQTLTGTSSQSDTNTLAGLGFSRGGRAGVYGLALYNFSYDENDPTEAYDSPWVYRVGVSFGF